MEKQQSLMKACLGEFEKMDTFRQGMAAGLAIRLLYEDENEDECNKTNVPTIVFKRKKSSQIDNKGA